jgi:hypothetical protein
MTYVLLTGAGFSRNWGGWLAVEAFNHLISCKLDDETRDLLIKHRTTGGFENAMSELQRRIVQDPTEANKARLYALTSEVYGMFNSMSQHFLRGQFEFQNDLRYMVSTFLSRFDAIFTVNQDTLLESHYFDLVKPRLAGVQLPGMKHFGTQPHTIGSIFDKIRKLTPDLSTFRLDPGFQPYFKLHGSINWVTDEKSDLLMVLGGDKAKDISRHPILFALSSRIRLLSGEAEHQINGHRLRVQ